jgi:hypothetical protein
VARKLDESASPSCSAGQAKGNLIGFRSCVAPQDTITPWNSCADRFRNFVLQVMSATEIVAAMELSAYCLNNLRMAMAKQ